MPAALRPAAMIGRPRIIVATPHSAECEALADWLVPHGFDPVKTSSVAAAINAIKSRPYDLLIADSVFAFRDGLDLASRNRRRNQQTPTVVIGESPTAESQAEVRGAMYLGRPVDPETLACTISMALMDERPIRRSTRKTVDRFDAVVDGVRSHLIDVSPEGMRLEIPTDRRSSPPPFFSVRVPMIGVALIVQRMWARRSPDAVRSNTAWYGGALTRNSSAAEQAWRHFVEAIPRGGSASASIEVG